MELMNTSPDSGLPIETLRYCLITVLVIVKKDTPLNFETCTRRALLTLRQTPLSSTRTAECKPRGRRTVVHNCVAMLLCGGFANFF